MALVLLLLYTLLTTTSRYVTLIKPRYVRKDTIPSVSFYGLLKSELWILFVFLLLLLLPRVTTSPKYLPLCIQVDCSFEIKEFVL